MIFVPEKEKCSLWNDELEDRIYIIYDYDKHTKIMFNWWKQKEKFDPFNIEVDAIQISYNEGLYTTYMKMLTCLEPACQALPQLRYNNIIKKWYCCCPSSMICTKNDDEDELKLFQEVSYFEREGFFDDPVKAIINWNKKTSESIIEICNSLNKDNKK